MNLLIDIGNSRIKWGLEYPAGIVAGTAIDHHSDALQAQLLACWQHIDAPARAAIACVSAKTLLCQIKVVITKLWPGIEILTPHTQGHAYGVVNAYSQPETLGVDRWLALLAVRQNHRLPVCLVDCGTAMTIDLLNSRGRHLGGVIAPGLALMRTALAEGTQDLTLSQKTGPPGLADNTAAAIHSGTVFAATGLIEHILGGQDKATQLIMTGGDAALLNAQLQNRAKIEPDLVLQGLALVLGGAE